tara:strand:+ start:418 stop:1173 length:756 start_codon:yes stop_codon:yes gene_type:complete
MGTISTAIMAGTALMGMSNANKMRKDAKRNAAAALEERQKQQAKLDAEVANYRDMKFTNPYANMENPFEDLTVATGAAEFQAQQGAQQRANILEQLRGAAGGSGIAGLAQTLANQGQLQARQISTDLQRQEMMNAMATAKGASMINMQERAGDAMVQQAESGRQATILGAQYGQAAGANKNLQQSLLNQRNANLAANQMMMNSMKTLGSLDFSGGGDSFGQNQYMEYLNSVGMGEGTLSFENWRDLNLENK